MNTINLKIVGARLKSCFVSFNPDNVPTYHATITFVLENGKELGEYSMKSDEWTRKYAERTFLSLSEGFHIDASSLWKEIENRITQCCLGEFKLLPPPAPEAEVVDE